MTRSEPRATHAERRSTASSARGTAPRRIRLAGRVVVSEGLPREIFQDLYHYFMTVSWPQLFVTIGGFFLLFDVLFGCLYRLAPDCVANLNPPGFLGDFFFSVETLATVGYGEMHPQTLYGHVVSMVEIFVGLMMLALITGLMFARFSRPRARFLFARSAVVRPLDGKLMLMFRAANARLNVVQDASAQLRLMRDEVTVEGYRIRRIIDLALVRSQHPVFALSWTLMHVIDAASPLEPETPESLAAAASIFILTISGTDETTGQVLNARSEYPSTAIHWGASFRDILLSKTDGILHIDYTKFHEVEPLQDPPTAQQ
jgi:inward rectifier potassium channel